MGSREGTRNVGGSVLRMECQGPERAGKGIGRPQRKMDKNSLINLLVENQPRVKIAKTMGVSKATLYKWLREISIKNSP